MSIGVRFAPGASFLSWPVTPWPRQRRECGQEPWHGFLPESPAELSRPWPLQPASRSSAVTGSDPAEASDPRTEPFLPEGLTPRVAGPWDTRTVPGP